MTSRATRALVAAMILAAGLLPVALYLGFVGRVPAIDVQHAREALAKADSRAVLVDVRPPDAFEARHVDGALNWPYERIAALASAGDVPEQLKGKRLILICDSGILAALATQKLRQLSVDATNVRGGMEEWVAGAGKPCGTSFCQLKKAGKLEDLPFRQSPWYEQWAAFASGFVIKPTYMLLALVLIIILRRQRSPDLLSLRWGLSFFLAGEAFCAGNYLFFNSGSYLFEYLHSFGMVLSFGFTAYAVFEGLDLRMVKYGDPAKRCAALGLCRSCIKYAKTSCGLQRVFLLLIPCHAVLALMLLAAEPKVVSYNTEIFGVFYNYSHPAVYQLFEIRYCPVLAVLLFAASFFVLLLKKSNPVPLSKVLFAAGMGPFGFGMLRLVLFAAYQDNLVWFAFWEEVTELMYVGGVAVIFLIFRQGLFGGESAKGEEEGA